MPGEKAPDELSDDDAELSGESIAHIHRLRRGEHHDSRPDASPRADLAMTPRGPSVPTHEALASRVLETFQNDPVLEARAIDIGAVGSGAIELTGWVTSTGKIALDGARAGGPIDGLPVLSWAYDCARHEFAADDLRRCRN